MPACSTLPARIQTDRTRCAAHWRSRVRCGAIGDDAQRDRRLARHRDRKSPATEIRHAVDAGVEAQAWPGAAMGIATNWIAAARTRRRIGNARGHDGSSSSARSALGAATSERFAPVAQAARRLDGHNPTTQVCLTAARRCCVDTLADDRLRRVRSRLRRRKPAEWAKYLSSRRRWACPARSNAHVPFEDLQPLLETGMVQRGPITQIGQNCSSVFRHPGEGCGVARQDAPVSPTARALVAHYVSSTCLAPAERGLTHRPRCTGPPGQCACRFHQSGIASLTSSDDHCRRW